MELRLDDLMLDGLKIYQYKDGYNFTSDSVLLANFVSTKKFVERYGELADWPESNITNRGKHMAKLAYDTIWKF